MPTPSPLATLVAALAEVCRQAEQHQSLLSKNEAATRAALIDPILRALGWDTANVAMVVPEFAVSNKQKPDYFLKNTTGATHIVIEAKKLGEDLDKMGHTGKLIGYAFTLKPLYHFVTDGLHWHCFSPNHSQYEPYERITLTRDGLLLAATQLLKLLDAAYGGYGLESNGGQPTPFFIEVKASSNSKNLLSNNKSLNSKPAKQLASPLTTATRKYQVLSPSLADSSNGKPVWLRLPDGTEHQIKSWRDTLVKATELVLRALPNLTLPIADKAGKKTHLISWEHPKPGLSNTTLQYQGQTAFVYLNYDATNCIANALYLLKWGGPVKMDSELRYAG